MRALPPKQRAAVAYHYLAGLPYAEIGDLLGGSAAAARRAPPTASPPSATQYQQELTS